MVKKSERREITELASTGKRKMMGAGDHTFIWRPTFMLLHGQQQGHKCINITGNVLTILRGERVERGDEGGATKVGVRNKGDRSLEQGVISNEELEEQKRRDLLESGTT